MNKHYALALLLAVTGCSGSEPIPGGKRTANDAPVVTTEQASLAELATSTDPASAPKPTSAVALKPAIALHTSEIVALVDLRKLEPIDGMTVSTATIEQWVASATATDKSAEQVLEQLASRLLYLGCVPTKQTDLNSKDAKYPSRVFEHGDLLIEAGVTEVERFGTAPELLAYIRPLGNLDLRKLDWPEGTEVKQSGLISAQLHQQGGILECRKRLSKQLTELGWQEYRNFLPGVDIPVEDMVPSQAFLLHGMIMQVTYRDDQGELIKVQTATGSINCQVHLSVAPLEPLLPGPVNDLEVRWSPLAMVYQTELSPPQLREQLERLTTELGYRVFEKPSEAADEIHLACEHTDHLDLDIEFKQSGKRTLVVVNEMQ